MTDEEYKEKCKEALRDCSHAMDKILDAIPNPEGDTQTGIKEFTERAWDELRTRRRLFGRTSLESFAKMVDKD